MPPSVGPDDSLDNAFALSAFEQRRDARSTWRAIAFCIEERIAFPPWVLRYLAETAGRIEDHLVNRDERHPLRLWQVLGLDRETKREHYDRKRDPVEIYEVIEAWRKEGGKKYLKGHKHKGEVIKSITGFSYLYNEDVLGGVGSSKTVRGLYYKGRDIAGAWNPENEIALDQMIAKNPPPSIRAAFEALRRNASKSD